jgi:hypothetical protein
MLNKRFESKSGMVVQSILINIKHVYFIELGGSWKGDSVNWLSLSCNILLLPESNNLLGRCKLYFLFWQVVNVEK